MPVQSNSIPYLLAGRDMMIQSRTGSGKTAAFLLPMIEMTDFSLDACQALILVPTRELAKQVADEAKLLAGEDGVRVVAVYGGVSYKPQISAFKEGAHIVVGTPGRILDHILQRNLLLDQLNVLVFDEADRMLSMGFLPDMKKLRSLLPKRPRKSWMFSATFPHYVKSLAGDFMTNPETLSLSRDSIHVSDTDHASYEVPAMDKDRCLVRLIEVLNPSQAIIFCNTKARVEYVAAVLQRFGYDADALSADLSQNARERVLTRVREGSLRFLIATDVASRGIDIPDLSHVFQYEPPEDPEAYIHRAGRTGRAGAAGEAITLVADFETMDLKRISQRFKVPIEKRDIPTPEDVAELVAQRLTALLEARLRDLPQEFRDRMQRFVPLARALGAVDDGLQVLAMLLDDNYQESIHSPADAAKPEPKPQDGDRPSDLTIQELVNALEDHLHRRDRLRKERMQRFLPLASSLGESEEEQQVLAMLIEDAHEAVLFPPKEVPKPAAKPRVKKDDRWEGKPRGPKRRNDRRRPGGRR